jgi:hypothetical protein
MSVRAEWDGKRTPTNVTPGLGNVLFRVGESHLDRLVDDKVHELIEPLRLC